MCVCVCVCVCRSGSGRVEGCSHVSSVADSVYIICSPAHSATHFARIFFLLYFGGLCACLSVNNTKFNNTCLSFPVRTLKTGSAVQRKTCPVCLPSSRTKPQSSAVGVFWRACLCVPSSTTLPSVSLLVLQLPPPPPPLRYC
jgi:hypothetical protein